MDRIKKIFTSRKTILEMLEDRGYNCDSYKHYTIEEINIMFDQSQLKKSDSVAPGPLDIKLTRDDGRTIYVKYRFTKFRPTKPVEKFVHNIFENEIKKTDTLIFIITDKMKMSKTIVGFINSRYYQYGYFLQIFSINTLQFNISHHNLVPHHRIISNEEKIEVLKRYNASSTNNFPKILREDPAAKYYGMRPNDVCEIKVDSIISGVYTKYRLCISNTKQVGGEDKNMIK